MKKTANILLSSVLMLLLVVSGGGFSVIQHICHISGTKEVVLFSESTICNHHHTSTSTKESACCSAPEADVVEKPSCCSNHNTPSTSNADYEFRSACCEDLVQKNQVEVVTLQNKQLDLIPSFATYTAFHWQIAPELIENISIYGVLNNSPPILKVPKHHITSTQSFLI